MSQGPGAEALDAPRTYELPKSSLKLQGTRVSRALRVTDEPPLVEAFFNELKDQAAKAGLRVAFNHRQGRPAPPA